MGEYVFDDQHVSVTLFGSLLDPEVTFEKPVSLKFKWYMETGHFYDNSTFYSRWYPYWNRFRRYFGAYTSEMVFTKRLILELIHCSDGQFEENRKFSTAYYSTKRRVFQP